MTCFVPIAFFVLFTAVSVAYSQEQLIADTYDEKLTIETLPDAKVLFTFDFETTRPFHGNHSEHYVLFPRTLGQVLDKFDVEGMELTLTQGRWQNDRWGLPRPGSAAPPGLDLRAWVRADISSEMAEYNWAGLTNSLSGLFCASLNFLDAKAVVEPLRTFSEKRFNRVPTVLRHGSLAREAVCTENLTPWTKLLPCRSASGLATLLNGYRLFDANYHSVQTRVGIECHEMGCVQRLLQTAVVVMDPLRQSNDPGWSLVGLFDRVLETKCPVARDPAVVVVLPKAVAPDLYTLEPSDRKEILSINGTPAAVKFQVTQDPLNVNMRYHKHDILFSSGGGRGLGLSATRYLLGSSQEQGELVVDLLNSSPTEDRPVLYYDVLPWFMRMYLHTFQISCAPQAGGAKVVVANVDELPRKWWVQHAKDRERPNVIEAELLVPALHQCRIRVEFDKAFMHFTEHRPDASRGFELGAAVLTIPLSLKDLTSAIGYTHGNGSVAHVFTEILQVQLPTPDFSMPYNVITFTCTIMAFFFGSVFSMTIRRVVPYSLSATTKKPVRVVVVHPKED